MNKLLVLLVFALPGVSHSDPIDKRICHQNFTTAIAACVDVLKNQDPITRAGAQKTCVYISRLHRDFCYAGLAYSACVADCQAAYDTTAANCVATYNPALLCDPGNADCVTNVLTLQANCISAATATLSTCTQACPIPPPQQ
jgi:hypothetical protein